MEHNHTMHTEQTDTQKWLKRIAIGTALVAGAVIIAPYVLPELGVGSAAVTEKMILALHGEGAGSGLAGVINSGLSALPGIGTSLAQGGLFAAATSGIVGIGGVLLGNYIERRDDGTKKIRWGNVIKTAALLTSALVAMPSILTGVSLGVAYLAQMAGGTELAASAIAFLSGTVGSIGTASMAAAGLSGAALTLPHLLTCGASMVPLCIAWATGRAKPAQEAVSGPFAERVVLGRASEGLPGHSY